MNKSNRELAAKLRDVVAQIREGRRPILADPDDFDLAAQRLEATDKPPFRQACRTYSGPEPQDCNWPFCGCDDHANKVLETLEECGYAAPDEARRLRAALEGEISEMAVKRAAIAMINFQRAEHGLEEIDWDHPALRQDDRKKFLARARAALEAATEA